MKRRLIVLLPIILALVACASIQQQWDKLTPDQKARIIINDFQSQIEHLFDQGKLYVASHPEKQQVWKTQAVPAFDLANKSLADVIAIGKTGQLTPDLVYSKVQTAVNNLVALLIKLGIVT